MSHDYYAYDNDGDATGAEHASSSNLWIPMELPEGYVATSFIYSTHIRSNTTSMRHQPQFRDFSGRNTTLSGG